MAKDSTRLHLSITGLDHEARGRSRGAQLAGTLGAATESYLRLFAAVGVDEADVRRGAERTIEAIEGWKPDYVAELSGIAAASGLELWQITALNARTEILTGSPTAGARECSTMALKMAGKTTGIQTWDWHTELDDFWHTQEVAGPGYRYVGLTEQGIVSKIGINEAGLALHFNILGHREDRPGGIPMHVLSAVVLDSCASINEALELIRSTPIHSSSAFTMLDSHGTVSCEMSPSGVSAIRPVQGVNLRTNHFLDTATADEEKTELYEPDSSERLELIRTRLASQLPTTEDELIGIFISGPGEAALCCTPDMSLELGQRWATLATVVTDPSTRSMRVLDGMPTDAVHGTWRELIA